MITCCQFFVKHISVSLKGALKIKLTGKSRLVLTLIDKKFIISNSGTATVNITGFEPTFDVTDKDINMSYEIIDAAKT